ncbi:MULTISPECIES: DUF4062 domain-containing protein [unclassified Brevibacterium]|uniref:DUF4062 domain-containing protein n=1 Tax=unclassified Brevibacterium TaxID=2614124 RepID=UPI0010F8CD92|nr:MULTISPECIES: DUF4062 domain-containing protein [unclassified Brevibacterium]MCM1011592.1 DUF4062 domain-containing protein [Brevibacterium sp. XM4083]
MTYLATAVRVMIASPSDTATQRDAIERMLTRWNGSRGQSAAVNLVPVRYEAHAVPAAADSAQSVINGQLLDSADIVIAIFGNKLGSATDSAISGTVEEIQRAIEAKIPVHVYFSSADVPRDQLSDASKINDYKNSFKGLYAEYADDSELADAVRNAIERDVTLWAGAVNGPKEAEADPVIQIQRENEVKYNSKGNPRNHTRRWIEITNQGGSDAEDFTIEVDAGDGVFFMAEPDEPRTLHRDDLIRIPYELTLGASNQAEAVMSWTEGKERKVKQRTLNLIN